MSFSVLRSPLASRALLSIARAANVRPFSATAATLKATGRPEFHPRSRKTRDEAKENRPLPTFEPTSNSELDDLLDTIRNELFIPSHLLRRHRNLMHRKKNHPILEEEPLIVDVKGTPVELKPKSRVVPIPVKTFSTALDLMKTPADMDAIPGLVMGFSDANSRIRDAQFEKMAREVNMNGRIDILMKLARGAGSNGFKFSRNVAREFMRGLKIQNSLPDKTIAIKALKNAETLLNLLGEARMKVNPDERLKRDPVVVGTLLSLFASTSSRFSGGKDYEGFTLMYAKRLQSCWEAVEWDQALVAGDKKSLWRAKFAVLNYKPVLEGLFQARDILQGSDIMPWVESESAKLNGTIGEWMKFLEENSDGENKMYGMHSYKEVAEKLAKELGVE